MPYVGRGTDKISNVEVLDNITFDGSSSYTLQKGGSNFTPSSANTLLLSIDGVVQAGNFTVSGSTIDFGTAVAGTSTCDFVLHYGVGLITAPSDGTVTTAKLADSSVSLAKLTATGTKDATTFLRGDNTFAEAGGGIEEADVFRLTADITTTGVNDITSNLERADDASSGKIGTGMTESSGIFTFPSTGIYLVRCNFFGAAIANDNVGMIIKATINNSSYDDIAFNQDAGDDSATGAFAGSLEALVDVTDVSNVKVKFATDSINSGSRIGGSTVSNVTSFTFIRLGDT